MKCIKLTILLAAFMAYTPAKAQTTVYASSFGAVPDDGKDDSEALRKAAEYARTHVGTTLVIEPGTYILRDEQAVALEDAVMSGAYGKDPEKRMFVPYHSYVRGLDFTGAKNITVEACGATLLLDGWMEGISIESTENFTLNGLTIDFLRKPMSEGVITDIRDNNYTVCFTRPSREITMDTPFPRLNIWDNEVNGRWRDTPGFNRLAIVGPNTVSFKGSLPKRLIGAYVGAPHSFHYRPAIFVHESVNTEFNNITINANCGMGILGFQTNSVAMNRMSIVPARGFHFSTNTDATHFASCEGTISFDHCVFRGEGDDATNVHGYYHDITSVDGKRACLALHAPTFTHAQMADVPRVGDVMTLVRIKDLVPVGEYKVKAAEHADRATSYSITTDRDLPKDFDKYYLINSTLMPKLIFQNCLDWGHMSRGVLVKTTGGTVIRDNVFRGISYPAIVLSSESWWKEGWQTKDVLIQGNKIINCNLHGNYYHGSGIAIEIGADSVGDARLHDNIVIEGNEIESCNSGECGIYVSNAKNVVIYDDNVIKGCRQDVLVNNADVKYKKKR